MKSRQYILDYETCTLSFVVKNIIKLFKKTLNILKKNK